MNRQPDINDDDAPELLGGGGKVGFRLHGGPRGGLQAEVVQEGLLGDPVLADCQGTAATA